MQTYILGTLIQHKYLAEKKLTRKVEINDLVLLIETLTQIYHSFISEIVV